MDINEKTDRWDKNLDGNIVILMGEMFLCLGEGAMTKSWKKKEARGYNVTECEVLEESREGEI